MYGGTSQLKDMIGTDPAINETILLHGTNAKTLQMILHEGQPDLFLDPRFTRVDMFGRGVYFAENVCKTDQYATPGLAPQQDHKLTKLLYSKFGKAASSKEIHFVFVCRVILGLAAFTQEAKLGFGVLYFNVFVFWVPNIEYYILNIL